MKYSIKDKLSSIVSEQGCGMGVLKYNRTIVASKEFLHIGVFSLSLCQSRSWVC